MSSRATVRLLVLVAAVSVVHAATGKLSGIVQDDAGQPLPEVVLRIVPVKGGPGRELETDKKGRFRQPLLLADEYRVELQDESRQIKSMSYVLEDSTGFEIMRRQGEATAFDIGAGQQVELVLVVASKDAPARPAQEVTLADPSAELARIAKLFETGDMDGVLRDIGHVLEAQPDLGAAHYLRGMALGRLGKYEEAEAALERARTESPEQPGVDGALGTVLLQRAQALEKKGPSEGAQDLYAKSAELLRAELARDPKQVLVRANLATALEALGRTDELASELGQLMAADPLDPRYPIRLAVVLHREGRNLEARAALERAPRSDPAGAPIAYNVAAALFNDGKMAQALEVARWGVEYAPELPDLHRLMARALLSEGRTPEAIAELERFLELAPDHPEAEVERKMLGELKKTATHP